MGVNMKIGWIQKKITEAGGLGVVSVRESGLEFSKTATATQKKDAQIIFEEWSEKAQKLSEEIDKKIEIQIQKDAITKLKVTATAEELVVLIEKENALGD